MRLTSENEGMTRPYLSRRRPVRSFLLLIGYIPAVRPPFTARVILVLPWLNQCSTRPLTRAPCAALPALQSNHTSHAHRPPAASRPNTGRFPSPAWNTAPNVLLGA